MWKSLVRLRVPAPSQIGSNRDTHHNGSNRETDQIGTPTIHRISVAGQIGTPTIHKTDQIGTPTIHRISVEYESVSPNEIQLGVVERYGC